MNIHEVKVQLKQLDISINMLVVELKRVAEHEGISNDDVGLYELPSGKCVLTRYIRGTRLQHINAAIKSIQDTY